MLWLKEYRDKDKDEGEKIVIQSMDAVVAKPSQVS